MGKFTVEQWRCDRCGKVAPKWIKPGTAHSLRAFVDYGTAGGADIEWLEMCSPCNAEVSKAIQHLKQSAKLDRDRETTSARAALDLPAQATPSTPKDQ